MISGFNPCMVMWIHRSSASTTLLSVISVKIRSSFTIINMPPPCLFLSFLTKLKPGGVISGLKIELSSLDSVPKIISGLWVSIIACRSGSLFVILSQLMSNVLSFLLPLLLDGWLGVLRLPPALGSFGDDDAKGEVGSSEAMEQDNKSVLSVFNSDSPLNELELEILNELANNAVGDKFGIPQEQHIHVMLELHKGL